MTATVEIDEWNGSGSGITTHGVVNLNVGAIDSPNIQTSATTSIRAGTNSYTKYHKLHFTNLGGAAKVLNIKVYISEGELRAGESIQTNLMPFGNEAYTAEAYTPPSRLPFTKFPVPPIGVVPSARNLGIAGSLTGELTVPGYSDFWKWQLQTTDSIARGALKSKTFTFIWDEE